MYEIQKDQTSPVNFFAGDYPVATAVREVSSGKSVKKYDPVKLVGGKVEPIVKVDASAADSGSTTRQKQSTRTPRRESTALRRATREPEKMSLFT